MSKLGTLQKLELRNVWAREDTDFTPWMAAEENIKILGDTIGLELEVEAQEQNVGPFRADILCKDVDNGDWVLIENQLERTDHTHLGQLMTYAAGLNAVTIVWVSGKFTEEHRAALDWLNDITDEKFRFFGLEIELWQIGDSLPAPKFNIISKPNDWSRSVSASARRISTEGLSDLKQQHLAFWELMTEHLGNSNSSVRPQKPHPQHWAVYGVGRTGFSLNATRNTQENRIGVELIIEGRDAKKFFAALENKKESIEDKVGKNLSWLELPARKSSKIALYKDGVNPVDEEDWQSQAEWMKSTLEEFHTVLRPIIRNLKVYEEVA